MNTDDFEKQLQRQPMRAVPPEWREQILSAVSRRPDWASRITPHQSRSWLCELLWPSPTAWAGLVAVWVVIFALQFDSAEPVKVAAVETILPSRQVQELLRAQQSLFAEVLNSSVPIETPAQSLPRPRGQRESQLNDA